LKHSDIRSRTDEHFDTTVRLAYMYMLKAIPATIPLD